MRYRCALVALLALFVTSTAPAQEKPAAPRGGGLPDLEQTNVSIPWNQLRNLLDGQAGDRARPPVDYVFSQAAAKVSLAADGKSADITFTGEVRALAEGFTLIPLGAADSGIIEVLIDGKRSALVVKDKSLFVLLDKLGVYPLEIRARAKVDEVRGAREVAIALPPAAIVELTATLPGEMLSVTASGALSLSTKADKGATLVTALFRGGQSTTLSWRDAPAADKPPRIYAASETSLLVDAGLARATTKYEVQIAQTSASEVVVQLPAESEVVDVRGTGVAGHAVKKDLVTIRLERPQQGKLEFEITYDIAIDAKDDTFTFKTPRLPAATREQGVVAVASTNSIVLKQTAASGRIGVSQLPEKLRTTPGGIVHLGYKSGGESTAIKFTLETPKAQPTRRFVTTGSLVSVLPGVLEVHAQIHYEVLHTGVESLRVLLPEGIELSSVTGTGIRHWAVMTEGKQRILVVDLKDLVLGEYDLRVSYAARFKETEKSPEAPLISHPDADTERGFVAIETRGNYAVAPAVTGLERIDVKELPGDLWDSARSPILFGYRYESTGAKLALGLTRHKDLDVLVAMSDVCEVSTVVTPDGKSVTKMMFVIRNNLKPFLTLKLPAKSQVWSALVDDRPVTPADNGAGEVLIPLRKSQEVEDDDDDSYRSQRERRRKEGLDGDRIVDRLKRADELDDQPRDLKPFDVEIVFVGPPIDLVDRGEIALALPQADVPVGHLGWAVFLPEICKVVDHAGNLKEVRSFTLPFRHFGDVANERNIRSAKSEKKEQNKALKELEKAIDKAASAAKAAGVLPVRVEIPITGGIQRFEKFLVVDEAPAVTLTYRKVGE